MNSHGYPQDPCMIHGQTYADRNCRFYLVFFLIFAELFIFFGLTKILMESTPIQILEPDDNKLCMFYSLLSHGSTTCAFDVFI